MVQFATKLSVAQLVKHQAVILIRSEVRILTRSQNVHLCPILITTTIKLLWVTVYLLTAFKLIY